MRRKLARPPPVIPWFTDAIAGYCRNLMLSENYPVREPDNFFNGRIPVRAREGAPAAGPAGYFVGGATGADGAAGIAGTPAGGAGMPAGGAGIDWTGAAPFMMLRVPPVPEK